jgi:hypothetical protein
MINKSNTKLYIYAKSKERRRKKNRRFIAGKEMQLCENIKKDKTCDLFF